MTNGIVELMGRAVRCMGPYFFEIGGIGAIAESMSNDDSYAGLIAGGLVYVMGRVAGNMPEFGINALRDKSKKVLETQVVEE